MVPEASVSAAAGECSRPSLPNICAATPGPRDTSIRADVPVLAELTGAGAIFHHDVVGEVVEGRCVVSATGRVEYGLSAVKVGMVVILPP